MYVETTELNKVFLVTEQDLNSIAKKAADEAYSNRNNEWWIYKQAAEYLNISVSKLKKLRASGEIIPYNPSPGIVRFNKQICDNWVERGGSK